MSNLLVVLLGLLRSVQERALGLFELLELGLPRELRKSQGGDGEAVLAAAELLELLVKLGIRVAETAPERDPRDVLRQLLEQRHWLELPSVGAAGEDAQGGRQLAWRRLVQVARGLDDEHLARSLRSFQALARPELDPNEWGMPEDMLEALLIEARRRGGEQAEAEAANPPVSPSGRRASHSMWERAAQTMEPLLYPGLELAAFGNHELIALIMRARGEVWVDIETLRAYVPVPEPPDAPEGLPDEAMAAWSDERLHRELVLSQAAWWALFDPPAMATRHRDMQRECVRRGIMANGQAVPLRDVGGKPIVITDEFIERMGELKLRIVGRPGASAEPLMAEDIGGARLAQALELLRYASRELPQHPDARFEFAVNDLGISPAELQWRIVEFLNAATARPGKADA